MAEEKSPGIACLISGIMSWLILLVFKLLLPGHIPWFIVFLPVFTIIMFLIALFNRKEVVLAIIGLLIGVSAVGWFFS